VTSTTGRPEAVQSRKQRSVTWRATLRRALHLENHIWTAAATRLWSSWCSLIHSSCYTLQGLLVPSRCLLLLLRLPPVLTCCSHCPAGAAAAGMPSRMSQSGIMDPGLPAAFQELQQLPPEVLALSTPAQP
jgi:hypothetical protein